MLITFLIFSIMFLFINISLKYLLGFIHLQYYITIFTPSHFLILFNYIVHNLYILWDISHIYAPKKHTQFSV